jgi:carbonic anhydrase
MFGVSVSDEMVSAAAAYATSFVPRGSAAPLRKVAVVACMDARLDLFALFGLHIGDAHVLRSAGGTVTDDTLRSLVISQRLLGTRETVLVHHTECGMTSFDDAEFLETLERETGVRPPWVPGSFRDVDSDVHMSLERLRACPWLISTAARGFVFDVETGRLTEVESAKGGRSLGVSIQRRPSTTL